MPEPCRKDRRVSSRRKPARRSRAPSRLAAVFNLDDPAERRALDWVQRFHTHDGMHRLLDIARACVQRSRADVVMLTRSQARRAAARPEFLVIRYEPDVIRVSWQTFTSLGLARAAFAAAVVPAPAGEVATG